MTITDLLNQYGMLILSGITIVVLGWLVVIMMREAERKNTTLGEVINAHFLKQFETWLIIVIITLWVTESLIAASIHPLGPNGQPTMQINSVARFMSHFGTALVGILMVVAFPKILLEFIESFGKLQGKSIRKISEWGFPAFYVLINLGMMFFVAWATIRLPFYNIELIGRGLNELHNVEFAWYEMTRPWTKIDYPRLGLPSDYNPWAQMSFQMFASFLILLCHYVISIMDSLIILKKLVHEKIEKTGARTRATTRDYSANNDQIKDIEDNPLNVIKELVKKTGAFSANELDEKVDDLRDIFLELSHVEENNREATRTYIAGKMAVLYNKWQKFREETRTMDSNQKDAHRKRIINETRELFANKKGFNYQLPRGN